jgi:hypothetical protein
MSIFFMAVSHRLSRGASHRHNHDGSEGNGRPALIWIKKECAGGVCSRRRHLKHGTAPLQSARAGTLVDGSGIE